MQLQQSDVVAFPIINGQEILMRLMKTLFFLLIPSLAGHLALYLPEIRIRLTNTIGARDSQNIVSFIYIASIFYSIAFIHLKLDKPAVLPVSFALTPISMFIYEYMNPSSFLQYVGTYLTVIFYALPFTTLTAIALLIIKIRTSRNKSAK